MLDQELFGNQFEVLQERFNRKSSLTLQRMYYQFLSNRLDDRQFVKACEEIFVSDVYWPTPERFIEAAGLSEPPRENRAAYLAPALDNTLARLYGSPNLSDDLDRDQQIQNLKEAVWRRSFIWAKPIWQKLTHPLYAEAERLGIAPEAVGLPPKETARAEAG